MEWKHSEVHQRTEETICRMAIGRHTVKLKKVTALGQMTKYGQSSPASQPASQPGRAGSSSGESNRAGQHTSRAGGHGRPHVRIDQTLQNLYCSGSGALTGNTSGGFLRLP